MKAALSFVFKLGVTVAIFIAIFLEFPRGYRPVRTATLREPEAFEAANPAFPGIVGQLRAPPALAWRARPAPCLPPPTPTHTIKFFKALRHCRAGSLTTVYTRTAEGRF